MASIVPTISLKDPKRRTDLDRVDACYTENLILRRPPAIVTTHPDTAYSNIPGGVVPSSKFGLLRTISASIWRREVVIPSPSIGL